MRRALLTLGMLLLLRMLDGRTGASRLVALYCGYRLSRLWPLPARYLAARGVVESHRRRRSLI